MFRMWHKHCREGQRLLDGYLIALTKEDVVRGAVHYGAATADEARMALEALVTARDRYWLHEEEHGCRRKSSASLVR